MIFASEQRIAHRIGSSDPEGAACHPGILCCIPLLVCVNALACAWEVPALTEKARDALRILEDPNWHRSDPWISRFQAEETHSDPTRRAEGRVAAAIQNREREAFDSLISSDITDAGKIAFCRKYIGHRNEGVIQLAYSELIRRRAWGPEDIIRFAGADRSLDRWTVALRVLPKSMPTPDRIVVARAGMEAALALDPFVDSRRAILELAAARILVLSEASADHDLILQALQRYPDISLFWVAASRLPIREQVRREAAEIYTDSARPVELRLATSLVAARNDAHVTMDLMGRIDAYLREFYTDSWLRWVKETASRPRTDPEIVARWKRLSDGDVFFAILRELPDEVLKQHMRQMLEEAPHARNILLPILARRVPEDLVETLSNRAADSSAFGALYLAAYFKPELTARVRALMPNGEYQTLEAKVAQEGLDSLAGLAVTLTLWE